MDKNISEIIHEINEHIIAISNALTELENRTEPDNPITVTVGEFAQRLATLQLS